MVGAKDQSNTCLSHVKSFIPKLSLPCFTFLTTGQALNTFFYHIQLLELHNEFSLFTP